MRSKSKATVYHVAEMAGVSPSTVSRFLNRTTFVSNSKRDRIENAIKATGYKPKFKMQAGENKRTMTIGAMVQNPDSPFTCTIVNDLEKTLIKKGYSLVIASGHWQSELETNALDYLLKSNVDGIIIITGNLDNQQILQLAKDIPVVTMGYEVKNDNICALNIDNVMGGYIATLHLLQQGHQHIAHIMGIVDQPDSLARLQGYKQALSEFQVRVNNKLIKQGDFSMEVGYQRTLELIDAKAPFSAIFAANDLTAYGAIKALNDRGYKVPEDVSVIGFDDLPTSKYFTPALTTLKQPIEEIGTICACAIHNLLIGAEFQAKIPPIDLILRESTISKHTILG